MGTGGHHMTEVLGTRSVGHGPVRSSPVLDRTDNFRNSGLGSVLGSVRSETGLGPVQNRFTGGPYFAGGGDKCLLLIMQI